jgi:uncharacterized phage-like protein YoqJ
MPKVAIVGSREFPQPERVKQFVRKLQEKHPEAVVVSGGARGVDSWAAEAAVAVGLRIMVFPANWYPRGVYDARAGFTRNTTIVENSDYVVAFWDGASRGTKDTMTKAALAGKKVYVVEPHQEIRLYSKSFFRH